MIRQFILSLLVIAVAAPLVADEAAAPLLFIERIEVRNAKRVSSDVVIAESRLRAGREYSENDLRDAATRLGRLPFLLSVDFALEKGSERGRHVLVLTVHETRPFFYLLDLVPHYSDEPFLEVEYANNRGDSDENLALGARWFVGRRGTVHLGFSGISSEREFSREYASLAVGYTQYDLFGTRAFATLNLKKPILGYGEGQLSPQLVVGVPLSANQTVTLQYDETRFAADDRRIGTTNYPTRHGQRLFTTRWSYNTTDEPFFPTRGTLLYVAPMIGWGDGARVISTTYRGPDDVEVAYSAYHTRFFGTTVGATRYFELTDRDSLWGNVRGEWAREEYEDNIRARASDRTARIGSVGLGYTHSFWSQEERATGDSRLELTARYSNRARDQDETPIFISRRSETRQVSAAWLRRSSWGTLRLGAGYAW